MDELPTRRMPPAAHRDTAMPSTLPWAKSEPSHPSVRLSEAPFAGLGFGERYEALALLGEGGMGVVRLCADRQIGRRVAMKLLRPEVEGDETRVRFLREARVQGQLEHPAVVPVYDLGVDPDGTVYFTMKRVHGATLEEVREGAGDGYSRRRLLTAFSNVCLAVHFAHECGVLHRDLKPANIMLGDFGEVYVLDWGLARIQGASDLAETARIKLPEGGAADRTHAGAVFGTPGYMAPEQVAGEMDLVGPATDVYALGAILFELLTDQRLHAGVSVKEVFAETVAGVEARPSVRAPDAEVPPELEALLVRATAHDPSERLSSAKELHLAVERYLDGERDEALRKEMASAHAQRAAEAAELAQRETSPQFTERRRAMREIGRALALDPDNPQAMEVLVTMLQHPPLATPREVKLEAASNERHRMRWAAKTGMVAYGSLFLFLPLFLYCGVRRVEMVVLFYGLVGAAALTSWMAARRRDELLGLTLVTLVLSNLAFAATATLFGPLLVTPTLIALNATVFTVYLPPRVRWAAAACGCAAVLGTLALTGTSLIPSYGFDGGGMLVYPNAIELPQGATVVMLACIAVAGVVIGAISVTRVRDALDATERQLFLYVWHLRELLPEAARAPTDPTAARRARARKISGM